MIDLRGKPTVVKILSFDELDEFFARQDVFNILCGARDLVTKGWCKGALARDAWGVTVHPGNHMATQWSLKGSVMKAGEEKERRDKLAALAALSNHVPEKELLDIWNDREKTTKTDVLKVLEAALEDYRYDDCECEE